VTELTVVGKRPHVTRNKRTKLAAVMAAEMSGVVEAAKQTGIPATTIEYWLHKPEFAAIRTKTREDLAEEYKVAAHVTIARLIELAPIMEPRDVIFAAEKSATILALLRGEATSRTETRTLTDGLDDHEKAALRAIIDEVVAASEVVA